ncbi:MAG: hypothetical protein IT453_22135 [Planctomycetes bacterium]|nr:hypothetical protein [Planctomycetota bacterium]
MLLLVVTVLSGLGFGRAVPEVAPVTLEQLVATSDAIVIGEVGSVADVKPWLARWTAPDRLDVGAWPIAEILVTRTLKGDPSVAKRHCVAFPTWTCDTSSAKVGERALFFLTDVDPKSAEGEALSASVEDVFGSNDVAWIAHSGRGKLLLSEVDGRTYAECWVEDVVVPKELPRIPGGGYAFIARLELAPFVARIEALRAVCVEIEVLRAPGIEPWSLAVRADRTATWVSGGARPRWRELRLDATTQVDALRVLRRESSLSTGFVFGGPDAKSGERRVRVFGESEPFELVLRDLDKASSVSREHAGELRTLLEVWSALRSALDDPTCADHRARDAQVLAGLPTARR